MQRDEIESIEVIKSDYYKLGKFITTTFFSNLKFKLKNDCICRAIADYFPLVSSASILLYDALTSEDRLANYGHYMDATKCSITFQCDEDKKLLANISIYEYLSFKYESNFGIEDCTYADYQSLPYFFTNLKGNSAQSDGLSDHTIDNAHFESIRSHFFESDGSNNIPSGYKAHQNYKAQISQVDIYPLDDIKSPSPRFFEAISNTSTEEIFHVEKLEGKAAEELKLWQVCHKSLGMDLSVRAIYIGFRLIANGRCIGILRVVSHYEGDGIAGIEDQGVDETTIAREYIKRLGIEQLLSFVDVMTLHIANSYTTDHLKSIDYSQQSTTYRQVCESFKQAINCNGCILRTYDADTSQLEIVGYTPNLSEYVKLRKKNDHFRTHSRLLAKLFQPAQASEASINSIFSLVGFQIRMANSAIKSITYMYQSANGVLHSTTDPRELHLDFEQAITSLYSEEVIKVIESAGLHNVLVLKLPFAEQAYLTFANTTYRPLILPDVEVIYPYVNRLGMEIHLKAERRKAEKSTSIRMIAHDLRPILTIIKIKAESIEDELAILTANDYDTRSVEAVKRKLVNAKGFTASRLIMDLAELANYHLKGYSFHRKPKTKMFKVKSRQWSLRDIDRLVDYCRSYADDVKQIGITKGWGKTTEFPKTNVDKQAVIQMFLSLMFNAVKFSDSRYRLIQKLGTNFNPHYRSKSPGHILVELINTEEAYGFAITNWGKRLKLEDIPKLRKPDSEKIEDDQFETHYSDSERQNYFINGSGNGLYYADTLAFQLGAILEIDPTYDEYKTTIRVQWKKINSDF